MSPLTSLPAIRFSYNGFSLHFHSSCFPPDLCVLTCHYFLGILLCLFMLVCVFQCAAPPRCTQWHPPNLIAPELNLQCRMRPSASRTRRTNKVPPHQRQERLCAKNTRFRSIPNLQRSNSTASCDHRLATHKRTVSAKTANTNIESSQYSAICTSEFNFLV